MWVYCLLFLLPWILLQTFISFWPSGERKDGEEKEVFAQKHFRLSSIFYAFVRTSDNERL